MAAAAEEALIAPKPRISPAFVFESDVQPILNAACTGCHNAKARKAELDLTTLAGLMKGGETGPAVVPGKPADSPLFEMLHDGLMPPDEAKRKLTAAEIETIRRWIHSGARALKPATVEPALTQHAVLPILYLRCTTCHGLRKQEAGLDLRTKAAMLKGGKSGPAIVPGKPGKSLILKRIHAAEMPPRKLLVRYGVRPMEAGELAALTKWIAAGAPEVHVPPDVAGTKPDPLVTDEDRRFWSFRPPRRAPIPTNATNRRIRTVVDAFLLHALQQRGLSFSPEADRQTLIRRVAFDLTGLPPEWVDVERFLTDSSPAWYERMVEHYLASPRYGERWGQFWLDLAGYADSEGKRSADVIRPNAWKYRDYVIRAFNNDKPYDRFLLEQLAGDELADYTRGRLTPQLYDNLIATGFLRMAPDGTGSDIVNTVAERFEVVIDEIDVLGSGVMGLTLKCAQCHSHKYDPIPQRDYYRLVAVLKGAYDVNDWLKSTTVRNQTQATTGFRTLMMGSEEERREWQWQVRELDEQIARLQAELKAAKTMLSGADFRKRKAKIDKQIKALQAKRPPQPGIRALWDRGTPSPTYVYRRGVYTNPGRLVGPGVPSVLTDGRTPFEPPQPWPGAQQSGRRLAFARWLTKPDHPLTARVMVNRIWKHHFGRGIVKTAGNFGKTGSRPTHPELLDWLAVEFVENGWSIKHIHRLVLTSSAYRQGSQLTPELESHDPENALLSRMPLRRMDAESLRDSLASAAGRLDHRPFGKPDAVEVRADGLVTSQASPAGWRRSIYVLHRRKEMPTILETFDLPQMIPNCIERPSSTVASQALHLWNNTMVRKLADAFAERVAREVGTEPYRQIERVYQIALSRLPDDDERQLAVEFLARTSAIWRKQSKSQTESARLALANYCHTILNSAAFSYVD